MKYLIFLLSVLAAICLSLQQGQEQNAKESALAKEASDESILADEQARVGNKADKVLEQLFGAVAEDDDDKNNLEGMEEAEEQELDDEDKAMTSQGNARAQSYYIPSHDELLSS